ncbi:MAG: carbon-nitrogen family hydrolase [Verrucomicrobiae bacterium]|nr:carbon-nitrogen family hydrolase [Verrucomicrobiae bacterium]MCB1092467.1 carbon-nitrogen family hydrolase [Verrucomicrobiae bacterium]
MNLICCQTDIAWEDKRANFERIDGLLAGVAVSPGSLLVFPELSTVGFTMNVERVGEPMDGESTAYFSGLARRLACHIIAGIPGRDDSGRGLNEAVCFRPDGTLGERYRKVHLFPLSGEGGHYLAGSEPILTRIDGWAVAPFICYDLRFPELFRRATRQGAELMVVIANWPAVREDHWITLLRARAIENQAYVAGVNRCGSDPNLEYSGASLIVSPTGEVLARADSSAGVISATLDRELFDGWRGRFPALADMKLI